MEKKTIYVVKYSTDQYDDYREHTHSAYEDAEDANVAKLDVLVNIITAIQKWVKADYKHTPNLLNENYIDDCLNFIIDKNSVWVEELNYYTKKQD
jgi:hypothetical protein